MYEKNIKKTNILNYLKKMNTTHSIYTFFKKDALLSGQLLRDAELEIVTLPKRRGTPKEELERIGRAITKEEQKLQTYEKRARILAKNLPQLKIVADYIYWGKQKHDLISNAVMTDSTLVFEGWCPKQKLALLEKRIKNKSHLYTLENIKPEENETAPVEI